MRCRVWLIALTLVLIAMAPGATADLSTEHQTLNLVCSNDDCSLSQDAVGDAMLSEEERDANPLQPVTVTLEFPMRPDQTSVSLLPGLIESMIIDFRIDVEPSMINWTAMTISKIPITRWITRTQVVPNRRDSLSAPTRMK